MMATFVHVCYINVMTNYVIDSPLVQTYPYPALSFVCPTASTSQDVAKEKTDTPGNVVIRYRAFLCVWEGIPVDSSLTVS
jgi:hypothetical protein